jgi:hypothetical protein
MADETIIWLEGAIAGRPDVIGAGPDILFDLLVPMPPQGFRRFRIRACGQAAADALSRAARNTPAMIRGTLRGDDVCDVTARSIALDPIRTEAS